MSDEESEYEEASAESKLAIATYFLSSAPPGEVKEVLAGGRAFQTHTLAVGFALPGLPCCYFISQTAKSWSATLPF